MVAHPAADQNTSYPSAAAEGIRHDPATRATFRDIFAGSLYGTRLMALASACFGTTPPVLRLGWASFALLAVLALYFAEAASAEEAAPTWDTIGALFRERCVMCHSRVDCPHRVVRVDC
jgi:hypothetical protein